MFEFIFRSPLHQSSDQPSMLFCYAMRLLSAKKKWRRKQRFDRDMSVLREMNDRELCDLGIGRGEFTREARSNTRSRAVHPSNPL